MSLSQGSRCLSCQHGHDLEVLLPHLAGVVVERIEPAGTLLCIRARARAGAAVCPACGRGSRRVHSRYERRLADAAVGGRRGGDPAAGPAAVLRRSGLCEDDVRRAGARPDHPVRAQDRAAGQSITGHRCGAGRAGGCLPGPGGTVAGPRGLVLPTGPRACPGIFGRRCERCPCRSDLQGWEVSGTCPVRPGEYGHRLRQASSSAASPAGSRTAVGTVRCSWTQLDLMAHDPKPASR